MKRMMVLGMALLVAAIAGCAQRTITITSNPPGALVYMNDQEVGRTPLTRDFIWYGTYDVQLRKDGYETLSTTAQLIAPLWFWPPFDFFTELAPWHVKDIRHQSYTLKAASTQPIEQTEMLARSAELRVKLESSEHTKAPTTNHAKPTTNMATTSTSTTNTSMTSTATSMATSKP